LRVHFQVIEGTRRRTQVFEGVVIKRQGHGARETFTVRKQSFGVGVERTFPLHSPKIERIEVAARGDVRRAKLYYLRARVGKQRGTGAEEVVEAGRLHAPAEAVDAEGVSAADAPESTGEAPPVEPEAEGEETPAAVAEGEAEAAPEAEGEAEAAPEAEGEAEAAPEAEATSEPQAEAAPEEEVPAEQDEPAGDEQSG